MIHFYRSVIIDWISESYISIKANISFIQFTDIFNWDIFSNAATEIITSPCCSVSAPTFVCMSSVWVRIPLHTTALVTHLHLPTLTTGSCVLPWTFISAHLGLPVWQETAGQLTRRRTPANLNAPLSVETHTACFYSSQLFVPSLVCLCVLGCVCVCVTNADPCGGLLLFYSPSHMASPHFITLLPLWAAVPTVLGGLGELWNFRSCQVWSQKPEFPPFSCSPQPNLIPLTVFTSNLKTVHTQSSLSFTNVATVITDNSRDVSLFA